MRQSGTRSHDIHGEQEASETRFSLGISEIKNGT